jgi:hypothetical protein
MTVEHEFRDPGEVPALDWIDKDLIDVDPTYQRELDAARVQRILDWFDWSSFGALVVAPKEGGRFNCTDGQHRLEAAKRHPLVKQVPGVIIAKSGTVDEAANFVAINANRKNVTPLQLYWAELAAGDPEAVTVAQVCERAGVTIIRGAGGTPKAKPGETAAIAAVRGVVGKYGAMRGRQMLEVLGKAQLAPITALQVRAAELLLTDPEFKDDVEPEALTEAIAGRGLVLEDEARAFAATHRLPLTRALASVWFKRTRKRRKPAAGVDEPKITRGDALRRAEEREAPEMAKAERSMAERQQAVDTRIASVVAAFGATLTEARILVELLSGRLATKEALHAALYGDDPGGGPEMKIIDVLVCKLRPKLDDHGITVMTVRGMGYQLTGEMVRRTEAVLRTDERTKAA